MGFISIVAGPRGSGKTSFCETLAARLSRSGVRVSGFLQKSERDASGLPLRLYAFSLGSGESRSLAAREGSGPFEFSTETFRWMEDGLALASRSRRDIIIVDEVGPLEILEGKGLRPVLDMLIRRRSNPLVVSLRPSLVEPFEAILSGPGGRRREDRIWRVESPLEAAQEAERAAEEIICHCQGLNVGRIVVPQDIKNGGSEIP